MKLKTLVTFSLLSSCIILSSCIKQIEPNTECDIEEAYIHAQAPEELFFSKSDTLVKVFSDNHDVIFKVRGTADLTKLAPMFRLTPGATIEPANGSVHDFSQGGVKYRVTSEDGRWRRTYVVQFKRKSMPIKDGVVSYDFENYTLKDGKYYVWSDVYDDGADANNWQTANPSYEMIAGSTGPDNYPSTLLKEGYEGAGVKLVTKPTGGLGAMAHRLIAAGNLFTGRFNSKVILTETMKATELGLPFNHKPLKFQGYYKYKRGEKFQDENGNILPGVKDIGSLYVVYYLNHDSQGNSVVLYGDNCQTSPQIVALARVTDLHETDEWTRFDVDFDYAAYGKPVDMELVKEYGYSMSIVCSASKEGELFRAAIGSTLCVDSFKIICEKEEEQL